MQYAPLRKILDKHRVLCSCHELHGLLCGMLIVDISTAYEHWMHEMEKLDVDRNCFAGDSAAIWQRLFDDTVVQIGDGDLRFRPLLHEDAAGEYSVRMRALTEWCNGFIYGIGVTEPGFVNRASRVSEASRKFLADVREIGAADCAALSGGGQAENEAAYECVVEYLGVGVVIMCDEIVSKNSKNRH